MHVVSTDMHAAFRALPDRLAPQSGVISAQLFKQAASYQPKERSLALSGKAAVGPKAAALSKAAAAGLRMWHGTSPLDSGGNDDSQSSDASSEESNPWADLPPLCDCEGECDCDRSSANSQKEAQASKASGSGNQESVAPILQAGELSASEKAPEAAAGDFHQISEVLDSEEDGFCKVVPSSI